MQRASDDHQDAGAWREPSARRSGGNWARALVVVVAVGLGLSGVISPSDVKSSEETRNVLFVGDSNALSIYASVKDDPGRGWRVSVATRFGCGVVPYTAVSNGVVLRPTQPLCREWASNRGSEIASQPADVAVLFVGGWEQYDRWVAGRVVRYSEREWQHRTQRDYSQVLSEMRRSATKIAIVLNGCHSAPSLDLPVETLYQWGRYAPVINDLKRIQATNKAALEAARRAPFPVRVLDLHEFLCRDGYTETMKGVTLRTDGLHFSLDGSRIIWSWMKRAIEGRAARGSEPERR